LRQAIIACVGPFKGEIGGVSSIKPSSLNMNDRQDTPADDRGAAVAWTSSEAGVLLPQVH
jgi:hypothetical protein